MTPGSNSFDTLASLELDGQAFHYVSFDNSSQLQPLMQARILAMFGDSITTDHKSPAGAIAVGRGGLLMKPGAYSSMCWIKNKSERAC